MDEEVNFYKERSSKKHGGSSNGGGRAKIISANIVENEEIASYRRACMIEKWMEKKVNDKDWSRRKASSLPEIEKDNDSVFFSSTSISSDSSSGGLSSSSDTEFFGSSKSRASCFAPSRLKNVKTKPKSPDFDDPNEVLFDGFHRDHQLDGKSDNLMKSKLRALKIYANLKKVKQPISPGGRLTSFINSLFTNGNGQGKKVKNLKKTNGSERKSLSNIQGSTCSSASSFSRSCLSKTPSSSRSVINGAKRTVRFDPVGVIVDEDSRPCGHKCIYYDDSHLGSDKFGKPPLPNTVAELNLQILQKSDNVEVESRRALNIYKNHEEEFLVGRNGVCKDDEEEEDDFDDGLSDSSSDLFELDHLAMFGNNRFCEELPVYETTNLSTNRAIASGLIR